MGYDARARPCGHEFSLRENIVMLVVAWTQASVASSHAPLAGSGGWRVSVKETKRSVASRIKQMAWSDDYREKLLFYSVFATEETAC
ncbi:MAG: hypothetical protein Ta2A_10060 [Treponemataceae bacterium]|nr:MAG: hypothetical protein Ta2A_10060 [Treponemataceae bacterium]